MKSSNGECACLNASHPALRPRRSACPAHAGRRRSQSSFLLNQQLDAHSHSTTQHEEDLRSQLRMKSKEIVTSQTSFQQMSVVSGHCCCLHCPVAVQGVLLRQCCRRLPTQKVYYC